LPKVVQGVSSLIPSFSLLYILRPAAGSATRYGNVAREA
jgi:hypothetical protein